MLFDEPPHLRANVDAFDVEHLGHGLGAQSGRLTRSGLGIEKEDVLAPNGAQASAGAAQRLAANRHAAGGQQGQEFVQNPLSS